MEAKNKVNPEQFREALLEKGIALSDEQMKQYQVYTEVLVEWNEKMNLTAITDPEEIYLKHFYDSITLAFYYDMDQSVSLCDVGAGAGFPSLPIKIAFPQLKVTIVDSLNKRITFLNHLASELGLKDVYFVHDRAETFGQNKQYREQFDIVTARAVARMSVLAELCLPLVKLRGHFVALKAAHTAAEMVDAKKGIKVLGGELLSDEAFMLPVEEAERHVVTIAKKRKTPKQYPRKPGTPNKMPIV